METGIKDFLTNSFQENTIVWLTISAGFGGLIGATIKYVFEQLITPQTNYKRKAKIALKRYSNPLLLSADSLVRCSELYLKNIDKNWITDDDDYFKMNILYCFGQYFGWCKVIEDKSFFELDASITRRAKNFVTKFYRVYKGLNSYFYFENIIEDEPAIIGLVEKASVKRMHIQAIGELMVDKSDKGEELPIVLKFTEFVNRYKTDECFKNWFKPLLDLLLDVKRDPNNLTWCRMSVFIINLQLFINFYDPKSKVTKKRCFDFLDYTPERFKEKVLIELSLKEKREIIATPNSWA